MKSSVNCLNLSANGFSKFVETLGEPAYRANQLIQWIHQRGVTDFAQMTNLSKALRERLAEVAEISMPQPVLTKIAKDGTRKWLFRFDESAAIETVFIPEKNRGTLCISSQAGCALNCSFCSTGKEGFNRNLTLAEIIGQLWYAARQVKVTNVVMMGMGEPLLNYKNVLAALELMTSDLAYGLSKYRVTVSTSGVLPAMLQLKADTDVALAVSLHAPTNALRNQLVPINKKYPLEQLIPLCRDYFPRGSKRCVTFEYVMLAGVNDQPQHAKQLIKLLAGMSCKMNLIPFNPFPKSNYKTSSAAAVARFSEILINAGINTRVRKTRGEDIDAACGQLAGEIVDRTGRHQRWLKTGQLVPESFHDSN